MTPKEFIENDPEGAVWVTSFLDEIRAIYMQGNIEEKGKVIGKTVTMLLVPLQFLTENWDEEEKRDMLRFLKSNRSDIEKMIERGQV